MEYPWYPLKEESACAFVYGHGSWEVRYQYISMAFDLTHPVWGPHLRMSMIQRVLTVMTLMVQRSNIVVGELMPTLYRSSVVRSNLLGIYSFVGILLLVFYNSANEERFF